MSAENRTSTHLKDHPANPFRQKNLESLVASGRAPVFVNFDQGDFRGAIVFIPPVDLKTSDQRIWSDGTFHWETSNGKQKSPELVLLTRRSKAGRIRQKIKDLSQNSAS